MSIKILKALFPWILRTLVPKTIISIDTERAAKKSEKGHRGEFAHEFSAEDQSSSDT